MRSTYDMLPSPANLVRWKVSEDSKCQCGQHGTLRHIVCLPYGPERMVLRVIVNAIETKINKINQGKLPVKECQSKVVFHKEGKKGSAKPSPKTHVVD